MIPALLDDIQKTMYQLALNFQQAHIHEAHNMDELGKVVDGGFAKAMWCGDRACEDKIKEQFNATSRNMPFDQTAIDDHCVCCGKPAKKLIYFAKAY